MVTYGNESYHIEAMAFKRANSENKIDSYCKQSDGKNNSKENYLPYFKRTEKNGGDPTCHRKTKKYSIH